MYNPPPPPRPERLGGTFGLLLALPVCLLLGLWTATQVVAHGFGFHPNLGPAWLSVSLELSVYLRPTAVLLGAFACTTLLFPRSRRWTLVLLSAASLAVGLSVSPQLYSPERFVTWALLSGGLEEHSPYFSLFLQGLLSGAGVFVVTLVSVLVVRSTSRTLTPTGSHGTARWGDGRELMTEEGLLLGRKQASRKTSKLLRFSGEGHLITVAPTRSGKGTGCVIPNLLTYPGSVVVTDPKGENYAVTARCRHEILETRTVALDPFDLLGGFGLAPSMDAFNPMDLIDPSGRDLLETAHLIADMLVLPTNGRGGEEQFWQEEARALLSGLILYVATRELDGSGQPTEHRTLLRLRELLTLPKDDFQDLMQTLQTSLLAGGLVARAAARLLQKEDKERSGVISTAQSHTHFLDSPRMADVLGRSTFQLRDLKRERVSLYLILPAHHLDTYSRWLRLIIASALHEMARTPERPAHRVLFLLDEFANLGRMNPVLRAVSLMAGYGAQLWLFLQDLSQLKGTYPDRWGTFLANADVLQTFGTNDYETSLYLSNLTGEATIHVESENESRTRSRGRYASRSRAASKGYSEKARKLLLPDEVRRLPRAQQILFANGIEPIQASKLDYLRDAEFRNLDGPLYQDNPMHIQKIRAVAT